MQTLRIAALQGPRPQNISRPTRADNLAWTVRKIRELSRHKVEVICLSEGFTSVGLAFNPIDLAESVPGPTIKKMMGIARQYRLGIICPVIEKRSSAFYITAVFIDPRGKIVGQYDKIHPNKTEIDKGIVPGQTGPTVIELMDVKMGCQMCFDVNWPQEWVNIKHAGAQVIFFCSSFSGGLLLKSYAAILRLPVIASTIGPDCRIYDRRGHLLAHQMPYDFVLRDLVFDHPLFHVDYQWDKLECLMRIKQEFDVEMSRGEAMWTVAGTKDARFLQKLVTKYRLRDIEDYLHQSEVLQRARRLRHH